jgi:hypothetical protein
MDRLGAAEMIHAQAFDPKGVAQLLKAVFRVGPSRRGVRQSSQPSATSKAAMNELVCSSHSTIIRPPCSAGEFAKPYCALGT